jgi:hypothetical protein
VPFVDDARKTPIVEKSEVVPCAVAVLLGTSGASGGDLTGEVTNLFETVEVEGRGHDAGVGFRFPLPAKSGGEVEWNIFRSLFPVEFRWKFDVEYFPFRPLCGNSRKWKVEIQGIISSPSASSKM